MLSRTLSVVWTRILTDKSRQPEQLQWSGNVCLVFPLLLQKLCVSSDVTKWIQRSHNQAYMRLDGRRQVDVLKRNGYYTYHILENNFSHIVLVMFSLIFKNK